MSADDVLLVFIDRHGGPESWRLLRGGVVVERGTALDGVPNAVDSEDGGSCRVAAIVPGDAVSLHWIELPAGLAPAQALAAARLMAAEVSAQPIADMHVALGSEGDGETARAAALTPSLAMAGWLGRLQAHGIDPDIVMPDTLLIAPPDEGFFRYEGGGLPLYRGPADAFSVESDLAALVLGEAPVTALDDDDFEAGMGLAVASPLVNLRQGAFAKRRRWAIEWPLVRRMALLAAGILVLTLAIQIAAILRYTFAADALEAETSRIAAGALPGGGPITDPAGAVERRLAGLGGGGAGYASLAAGLFGAVQATPNVQLTALAFDRDGSLRATVQGDTPASFTALRQRIEAAGLVADIGPVRGGGGRPTADLTVRAS